MTEQECLGNDERKGRGGGGTEVTADAAQLDKL